MYFVKASYLVFESTILILKMPASNNGKNNVHKHWKGDPMQRPVWVK